MATETKKLSGAWIAVITIGAMMLITGMLWLIAANSANRQESNIKAAFEDSQNILGQLAPKLSETIGVANIQTEALARVITAANQSRMGEGGSKAVTQFIVEQNPTLDQGTFRQASDMIESVRNDFAAAQKQTIDRNRGYRTALGSIPTGFFMRMAGYPTQDYLDHKYDDIVMSGHAANAFESRRDNGVDIKNMN